MTRFANPQLALQWRQRIDRFVQSDWTVAEFCRLEGYSPAAFYQWRRKLTDEEAQDSARFVPVEVLPGDLRDHHLDCIEVSLPGGALVKLPASVAWTDFCPRNLTPENTANSQPDFGNAPVSHWSVTSKM